MQEVDLIVIGGGPGGYELAAEAAAAGRKTVLIERDTVGGTCLNRGCIPTKCLCASAKRFSDIASADEMGIAGASAALDFGAVKARMRRIVGELVGDVENALRDVTVVKAEARILPDRCVQAGDEVYTAPMVVIATGSAPANLPIEGASLAMDSTALLKCDELPESMVVIGGGVIGLEFASVFNAFGTKVTVLEYAPSLLPGTLPKQSQRLQSMLKRKGITLVTDACVTAIEPGFTVRYTHKGKEKTLEAACVLSAVGRRPVLPPGTEEAGIALTPKGFIATGDDMQTSIPGIYAIGDVNGRWLLAHAASAQARLLMGHKVRLDLIPAVVFTDPECAWVALPHSADDPDIQTVEVPYGSNGMALASGEEQGMAALKYSVSTGRIIGCYCLGAHADSLVAEATAAIYAGLTIDDMANGMVHAHPTLSELLAGCARRAL